MSSKIQALLCLGVAESQGPRSDHYYGLYFQEVLPGIAAVLDGHSPLHRNAWSDQVLATFESHGAATECALDLRDFFANTNWKKRGLSEPLDARVGLHSGPVYRSGRKIRGFEGIAGPAVDRVLQVSAAAPRGVVWCSRAFATQLQVDLQSQGGEGIVVTPAEPDADEDPLYAVARAHDPAPDRSAPSLKEINDELRATAAEVGCRSCSIRVLDGAAKKYTHFLSAFGPGSERILGTRVPADAGIAGSVIKMCLPRIDNDLGDARHFDPSTAQKAGIAPHNMLTVPVFDRSREVIGVAQFVNKANERNEILRFDRDDIAVAERFAASVAPALAAVLSRRLVDGSPVVRYEGTRECSIVFTDLTHYGQLVEQLAPENLHLVPRLLNEYLQLVCKLAPGHHCWVDKFLGDGAMVLSNAPVEHPDFSLSAVRFALELSRAVEALIEEWLGYGWDAEHIRGRIAIATGEVFLKNMGTPEVSAYTAIGPAANLAWRLLSHADREAHSILICPRTRELAQGQLAAVREAEAIEVDHKDRPGERVVAYRLQ